jgi:cell wall-associated NlpC family hydrolase
MYNIAYGEYLPPSHFSARTSGAKMGTTLNKPPNLNILTGTGLMKNDRTTDQQAPIVPSACRRAHKPASGGSLVLLSRLTRAGRSARRFMPALLSLLLMTALLIQLSTGMAPDSQLAGNTTSGTSADSGALPTGQSLLPPETDYQDDLLFSRSSDIDSKKGTAEAIDLSIDSWPDPTEPELEVSPIPTFYPQLMDIKGIPQEGMPAEDFIPLENTCYVKVKEANVREQPNTAAEILVKLTMGDIVTQTGEGLFWSSIKTASGLEGFVLSSLITTDVVKKPTPTPKPRPRITPGPVGSTLTSDQKKAIVTLARSLLGVRYHYGGNTPIEGFDCSGFTCYIYKTLFRITLPRSAHDQARAGVAVRKSDIEIGDIICFDWDSPRGVDHVGLYIGGGHYIHAAYHKGEVLESVLNLSSDPIVTIRRIIH